MEIFLRLQVAGLEPSRTTCAALLAALHKGKQGKLAQDLQRQMAACGLGSS